MEAVAPTTGVGGELDTGLVGTETGLVGTETGFVGTETGLGNGAEGNGNAPGALNPQALASLNLPGGATTWAV